MRKIDLLATLVLTLLGQAAIFSQVIWIYCKSGLLQFYLPQIRDKLLKLLTGHLHNPELNKVYLVC